MIHHFIGYLRVSTVGQAEDGYGLEIQEAAIRERIGETHKGIEIHVDAGVSGKLLDRFGLSSALRAINKGDVLIVARLDRLARDLISQELLLREIQRRGGRLWSCAEGEQAYLDDSADDPSRRLIRQVLGAVSEYERAMVTLRLRAGRRAKQKAGGFMGGEYPFGFRTDGNGGLRSDEREQEILRFIASAREVHQDGGRQPYELIAERLNLQSNMQPRKGQGRWTKQTVWSIAKPRMLDEAVSSA